MMKTTLLMFTILLWFNKLSAQITDNQPLPDLSEVYDKSVSISDQAELEENLKWLKNHPLNLNDANLESLNQLFFLNQIQKEAILAHKKKYGKFLSVFELQSIQAFTHEELLVLKEFVAAENRLSSDFLSIPKALQSGNHEIILQNGRIIQNQRGFIEPGKFLGSPDHLSLRYRFHYKKVLRFGFGLEKDAGEKWGKVGDFQTFHLFYEGKGRIKTLALGDFHAVLGNGLTLGTSFFNGKSSLLFQTSPFLTGITPSRSLNENGFLRGAAITFGQNKIGFSAWIGLSPMGAKIERDTSNEFDKFSAISLTGLHRTTEELARKNSIQSRLIGISLLYKLQHFSTGLILSNQQVLESQPYWQNFYQGKALTQSETRAGFWGKLNIKNNTLNAEITLPNTKQYALLVSGIFPISSKFDVLVLYRNYKGGLANFANAWSSGTGQDEIGLYTSMVIKPNRQQLFGLYLDLFSNRIPSGFNPYPKKSSDIFFDYQLTKSKKMKILFRLRIQESNTYQANENLVMKEAVNQTLQRIRIQLDYTISQAFKLQVRVEQSFFLIENTIASKGILLFEDLSYKPTKSKWNVRNRFYFYQDANLDARFYQPDIDLPYNFSQLQLIGNGLYNSLVIGYDCNQFLKIACKIGHHFRPDLTEIGSSLDEIAGNKKTEIKIQLLAKF